MVLIEYTFWWELILCDHTAIDLQHLAIYKPTIFRTKIAYHGTDIVRRSKATGWIFFQ